MGSKSPSTPDIRQLPATQAGGMTPTITPMPTIPTKDPRTTPLAQNEFGFNKRFANQEAFDSAYQNYLDTYKDDYSQYQKGTGRKLIPGGGGRRPFISPNFSGEKIIPTMEEFGQTVLLAPGVSLEEAYNNAFGPLAIQSPDSTAGIMAGLPQVPTPPGMGPGGVTLRPGQPMIPEQGPLRPRPGVGFVPRPPGPGSNAINQAQEQFGQYGFDEDVMNFLAGNIQKGYIDAGMNIGYNPETEMFSVSGGRRPGPTTNYTLDQFTNQFIGSSAPSTGTPQPIKQPPMSPGEILNPIKNPAPIQTPIGVPQPINQPPMELINPIRPGIQQPFNQPPIQTPIGGTPLPAPIQPTNPVTGNTSPIGGSQQDFDAYMNSYVNNLINQRMKNVFGGIMNALN